MGHAHNGMHANGNLTTLWHSQRCRPPQALQHARRPGRQPCWLCRAATDQQETEQQQDQQAQQPERPKAPRRRAESTDAISSALTRRFG